MFSCHSGGSLSTLFRGAWDHPDVRFSSPHCLEYCTKSAAKNFPITLDASVVHESCARIIGYVSAAMDSSPLERVPPEFRSFIDITSKLPRTPPGTTSKTPRTPRRTTIKLPRTPPAEPRASCRARRAEPRASCRARRARRVEPRLSCRTRRQQSHKQAAAHAASRATSKLPRTPRRATSNKGEPMRELSGEPSIEPNPLDYSL